VKGDPFSGGLGVAARWSAHADEGDRGDSAPWAEASNGGAGRVPAADQSAGDGDDADSTSAREPQKAQTDIEEDEAIEPGGDETRSAVSAEAGGGLVATDGFEGRRGSTDSETDRWSAGATAGGDSPSA